MRKPRDTEQKLLEASIRTFVRFGPTKTTMQDVANEAGVSRQTVYDVFGNKDALMVASIRLVTTQSLAIAKTKILELESLAEQLEAYFEHTVRSSFELLQQSGDLEDLIRGHSEAGAEEIERSHERHRLLVADLLAPYEESIREKGETVEGLSRFLVSVAINAKYSARDRDELTALLTTLKNSVLQFAGLPIVPKG
ncbi:MAG: TetR/AcrR family transcriptional regulator [Acidobacteriota bacterium]